MMIDTHGLKKRPLLEAVLMVGAIKLSKVPAVLDHGPDDRDWCLI